MQLEHPMPNATVRANARTLPKATPHPDADILALAEQCIAADRVRNEAAAALEKVEERCRDRANPPVIIRTERDRQLGLFVGNRVGMAYGRGDIPVLRALVRANSIIGNSSPKEAIETWERASRILDALRDLKEEEAREGVESGLTDAKRCYAAAVDAYDDLAERLLNTPAKTIEGVLAKARTMQHVYLDVDVGAALQERMRRMGPDDEAFATSLARDLISCASPGGAHMNAAPEDPIFAAIAQHIVARDALIEAIPRADKVTARLEGREVTKADEDAVEALNLDEEAAF
jgi:hypothetical protein